MTCKNALSTLSTHLTVSVILPAPRHLQIIILNDKESLPSCIPVPYSNWQDGAVISVFVNTSVSLEVSVAVGTNLTFVLRYRGSATNAFEYRSSDGSLHCAGSDCRGVIQVIKPLHSVVTIGDYYYYYHHYYLLKFFFK